jgi:hypothetical protein
VKGKTENTLDDELSEWNTGSTYRSNANHPHLESHFKQVDDGRSSNLVCSLCFVTLKKEEYERSRSNLENGCKRETTTCDCFVSCSPVGFDRNFKRF